MNGRDDPDPQALLALNRLSGLHPTLYEVVDLAIELARAFFDDENRAFDPYTFSHLVRYHIWNLLDRSPHAQIGYSLEKLANTGLEVRYAGCVLKIWKSDEGVMPAPGDSEGRKLFMTQPTQPLIPELFAIPMVVPVKLAVIWDVTTSLGLTDLCLVCPKGFDNPWKPGEVHWTIPIPHPATQIQADTSFEAQDDDLDLPLDETGGGDDDDEH